MATIHKLFLAIAGGLAFVQAATGQAAPVKPAHWIELAKPLTAEMTLEERLDAKGAFQAEEGTLKGFAAAMETALDTSVVLRTKKLEEVRISTDSLLTYKLKNVRVKTALKLILGDAGLAYVIEDNVLLITTPEDAGSKLVTHVYDCCDLLDGNEDSAQGLFEVITTLVDPDSWDFSGPSPQADFKGLLVISQSQAVHEKIEKFLNQLHQARGIKGKIKVMR